MDVQGRREFNEFLKENKAMRERIKLDTITNFYDDLKKSGAEEKRALRLLYNFFSLNGELTITDNTGKTSNLSKLMLEYCGEEYFSVLAEAYKEALEACEKRIA